MTMERYEELKQKYYCGPLYNNSIEFEIIGFYVDFGGVVPELESEPGVKLCGYRKSRFYHVFAPKEV